MSNIKQKILAAGMLTIADREEYFPNVNFKTIRKWMKDNDIDEHTAIELVSTEIALRTPFGILMQIRASDNKQLGMWGGVLEGDETPEEGAIRELREETGIVITQEQLQFVEINEHFHIYANGDKALFKAYRFIVDFERIPKITTCEESVGAFMVVHTILDHQQDFIKRVLGEKK